MSELTLEEKLLISIKNRVDDLEKMSTKLYFELFYLGNSVKQLSEILTSANRDKKEQESLENKVKIDSMKKIWLSKGSF